MRRRAITAGLLAAAVTAASLSMVSPASADHGWCSKVKLYEEKLYPNRLFVRVPVESGGSSHCFMAQGSVGRHVAALQYALNNCYGLNTGGIDGDFGPRTYRALRTAQDRAGVAVDGVYGPETRNALRWPTQEGVGAVPTTRCIRWQDMRP